MEMKMLAEKLNKIEMPIDMQERIMRNCYQKTEEKEMCKSVKNKNARVFVFKKPAVAAASLMLCLCLTGVTALAATGKLEGFFRDIRGWNGAVTGTAYEQATEEILLGVAEVSEELTVAVTMVNPQKAPYLYFETFGVKSYEIVDENGKVLVKGKATEMAAVADGKVTIRIPLEEVPKGEYRLIVKEFVGGAKAEQPLVVSGVWECGFTK